MSVVKDLVGSIKAGKFDEKLAAHLETGGLALVDSFRKETLSKKLCDTEQQLAVYFCYLKRIVAAFGVEEIRPWSSMILGCLQRDGPDEADQTPTLELLTSTTASLVQLVMQKETALTNAQAATIASSASPVTSSALSTSSSSAAMTNLQGSASPIPISSSVGSSASSPQLHSGDASSSTSSASTSVGGGLSSDSTSTTTTTLMQISTSLSPTLMSHHHQHYPFYYGSQTTTMAIASPMLGTSLPPISATLSPEKISSLGLNPSSTSSTSTSGHSPSSSLTTQSVVGSLPNSGSGSHLNINSSNTNNSFRQKVFNLYFTRRSSTIERILLDYADTQTFVRFMNFMSRRCCCRLIIVCCPLVVINIFVLFLLYFSRCLPIVVSCLLVVIISLCCFVVLLVVGLSH